MANSVVLKEVLTALATPFDQGVLDQKSFVRLVHQQIQQKVNGMVLNGTTGESPCLSPKEIRLMFDIARAETRGTGIQLIVGTGSNSTQKTCEFSAEVSQWGPDALMVVVPYYNRPTQRGMVLHFTEVAKASCVPLVLYNVPSRTGASMEPQTAVELSHVDGIVALKEATGDMNYLRLIRDQVKSGFAMLSGDDASCVEFAELGGHGVISVSSHIVGLEMKAAIQKAQGGEKSANVEYRAKYAELMKHLYIEANPIPVKMALHWMGVFQSPELRLPLTALNERFHGDFKTCLKNLGKI